MNLGSTFSITVVKEGDVGLICSSDVQISFGIMVIKSVLCMEIRGISKVECLEGCLYDRWIIEDGSWT